MPRTWVEFFSKRQWLGFVGVFAVVVLVFIGYYPSIRVGFLGDDWWFLGKAASLNLSDYIKFYFDPTAQIFWYRPLYGILMLGEYWLFHANPDGYHWGQILLHAFNCLLLCAVVWQFTRRQRLAFLTALFYAALPVNGLAIFWIAVQDPLSMTFYLAAIWAWQVYLQQNNRRYYALAFGAFVLSILGKESSVFLPVTLFLIDRLLLSKPIAWRDLFRRYTPFGIAFFAYLALEYRVQSTAYFPNRWGYSFGPHVFENLAHYSALLFFPWGQDEPIIYVALALGVVICLVIGLVKRSRLLLFLAIQALLTIAPALAFPVIFFQARYLYFASAMTALLFALIVDGLHQRVMNHRWLRALPVLLGLAILVANSAVTAQATVDRVEEGRRMRVPLRDIYRDHPSYPPDTYLYFIEPPYPMIMRNLYGMFYLPYGSNVMAWSNDAEWGGVDEDRFANLREHKNSFVYYFDDNIVRHEVAVDPVDESNATPSLPAHLQSSVNLEGYEVTASRVKSGADLVLLLYWQASAPIDKDYTVFVHLIDENGATVFGDDSQPRGGRAPTTTWKSGKLVVDAHILTMPQIPPGKYRLAIGMYDLATQKNLSILDVNGTPFTQQIIIGPIEIVE